jgi:hypothetical protein
MCYGFLSVYITSVAVACTQLEKLRAALLNIRQEHVTPHSEQGDGLVHDLHGIMQQKLNACIRHHQQVLA